MIYLKRANTLSAKLENYFLILEHFDKQDVIPSHEYLYYLYNYSKLYPGEEFFSYTIKNNFQTIGTFIGVRLKECIVIDYLVIKKLYRQQYRTVAKTILSFILKYNLPIVIEADSVELCRLYKSFGFKLFQENHMYYMLNVCLQNNTYEIHSSSSHLLILTNKEIKYNDVCNTLYIKHYSRWYEMYDNKFTQAYKEILKNRINTLCQNYNVE